MRLHQSSSSSWFFFFWLVKPDTTLQQAGAKSGAQGRAGMQVGGSLWAQIVPRRTGGGAGSCTTGSCTLGWLPQQAVKRKIKINKKK